jgi:hypothetical protein
MKTACGERSQMGRRAAIAILALGLGGVAGAAESRTEPWPAFERAFKSSTVLEVGPWNGESLESMAVGRQGPKCPSLPITEVRRYRVRTRFEPTRTLDLDVLVGLVPPGLDVPRAIMAAAPKSRSELEEGCILSKSGFSFAQMDRYLIAFPSVCSDIYPHKKSLPIVLRDLKAFFGARFPKQFVLSPCGQMRPELARVDDYLAGRFKP